MKTPLRLAAVLALCHAGYASAQVIAYDNTAPFSGFVYSHGGAAVDPANAANTITTLVADHLNLIPGAGGQAVTSWVFSVSNLNATAVSARPRVRFYQDDGAGGAPGTFITGFSFAPISFAAGSVQLFSTTAAFTIPVNGSLWAGITFDNNAGATGATAAQLNLLGQGIFGPQGTGTSEDLFFQTSGNGSFLVNNPVGGLFNFGAAGPVADFGWRFTVSGVPEPGTFALGGLAAGVAGLLRLRRRSVLAA